MGCGCDEKFTGTKTDCSTVVCLGKEDLCLGCGETKQNRYGKEVTITKVNSSHIMFCESGKPVEYYLQELRRMFPYIECGLTVPTLNIGSWINAEISAEVDSCAIGLPGEVTQRIPFMEGDVTRHNGCLWISLVNNNLTEPTEATQDSKEWLCLSSIDSRFDLLEQCCEEVKDRVTLLEECIFPEGAQSLCERVNIIDNTPDIYVSGYSISGQTLTINRSDGQNFSVTLPTPPTSDVQQEIAAKSGSISVTLPAINQATEQTVFTAYTAPSAGMVDITGTVSISLLCNAASPSAAVDVQVALYLGTTNLTGWQNMTRISRYNPAAAITQKASATVRATRNLAAGQNILLRVRAVTIVEQGSSMTVYGYTDGTFK